MALDKTLEILLQRYGRAEGDRVHLSNIIRAASTLLPTQQDTGPLSGAVVLPGCLSAAWILDRRVAVNAPHEFKVLAESVKPEDCRGAV